MKKAAYVIFALALCAAMSLTAFAATIDQDTPQPQMDSTNVKFQVDPTYSVTIPAEITLEKQGTQYVGSGDITAEQGLRLLEGKKIEVTLTGCDYQLDTDASAAYKLPYTVAVDGTAITESSNLVATFTTEDNAAVQVSTLTFTAGDPKYAGEYKDTVTFTVAVVDQ